MVDAVFRDEDHDIPYKSYTVKELRSKLLSGHEDIYSDGRLLATLLELIQDVEILLAQQFK